MASIHQEILALHASPSFQARISTLLEKSRNETLTPEEENEWVAYEHLEHLVRLAKARAYLELLNK